MRFSVKVPRGPALLSAIAVVVSMAAWALQASAAADLRAAAEIQQSDIPEGGAAPESIGTYREVLVTLDESIAIRERIDKVLAGVEKTTRELRNNQDEALAITRRATRELRRIAEKLGGAVGAAEVSVTELDVLQRRLNRSSSLAALIARELAELDRSLGP